MRVMRRMIEVAQVVMTVDRNKKLIFGEPFEMER